MKLFALLVVAIGQVSAQDKVLEKQLVPDFLKATLASCEIVFQGKPFDHKRVFITEDKDHQKWYKVLFEAVDVYKGNPGDQYLFDVYMKGELPGNTNWIVCANSYKIPSMLQSNDIGQNIVVMDDDHTLSMEEAGDRFLDQILEQNK